MKTNGGPEKVVRVGAVALLLLGLALPLGGARPRPGPEARPGGTASAAEPDEAPVWRGRFPNVLLKTHDGRSVRFYDDLLSGRRVVLNFMYVECGGT